MVGLAWLQRALPLAIIAAVTLYEVIFELQFRDLLDPYVRFVLEMAIFAFLGAVVVWLALEWVQRRLSEQARVEAGARAQEQLLATITANSADAIIVLDEQSIVRSWNRGAEQLFGYHAGEMLGSHFMRIVPDARRPELGRIDAELKARGRVDGWITERVTRDGRTLTVELTRTLLYDEQGRVIGSTSTLRDVTERERAQNEIREMNRRLESLVTLRTRELSDANQELRRRQRELEKANEELKELDQLKSEFVSLVSHELRAPLANISGSLQLLLDEPHELTLKQRDLLSLTNEQAERLARLVKGILNVSRIEAGQAVLQPQAFDIEGLALRALNQWQTCDPTHTYEFVAEENLPSIWADPDRVEEVLTNLIENASKYSPEGTRIRVEAQPHDGYMVIAVTDQGEGISPAELERIFDKFYRVERGDSRKTYGYGLGLYISFKLVEEMGGHLWAESQLHEGSTFYFSLPLAGHLPETRTTSAPHLTVA
jgi:PAS domain S-box-containing protein